MSKLKSVIEYEFVFSIKYVGIFYAIEYGVVALLWLIFAVGFGIDEFGLTMLETNTIIYMGVLGNLGYSEDFRMLIQNGFTRKYIFLGACAMFGMMSAIMSLADALLGKLMCDGWFSYHSMFELVYGREYNFFLNWLWLFLFYMTVCFLAYFIALLINKFGKRVALYFLIAVGVICGVGIPAAFRLGGSEQAAEEAVEFIKKAVGILENGAVNPGYAFLTFLVIMGVFCTGCYAVIQKTEIK